MTDDPIAGILGLMQTEGAKNNPPGICIGTVTQVETLQVKTDDLVLDREDLLVSHLLLDSYGREITNISDSANQPITTDMKHIEFKTCLAVGDLVALIPTENYQMYIVLCKVV